MCETLDIDRPGGTRLDGIEDMSDKWCDQIGYYVCVPPCTRPTSCLKCHDVTHKHRIFIEGVTPQPTHDEQMRDWYRRTAYSPEESA